MVHTIAFQDLAFTDLHVDAVYQGGDRGSAADDPISKLLPVGVQGGFRIARPSRKGPYVLAALITSGADPDWPDEFDVETGLFTYYGDNKQPGRELHNTKLGGNELLRFSFAALHADPSERGLIPPFFIFESAGRGRDVVFRGIAIPGTESTTEARDLIAIWRTRQGSRFQNYRALFTVLDSPRISRYWIEDLKNGKGVASSECPAAYREWVKTGRVNALEASPTVEWRSKDAQQPADANEIAMVRAVYDHFRARPTDFESCAVRLWAMEAGVGVIRVQVTQPIRDRGRDATGRLSIGPSADRLHMEFALEAKCYELSKGVGVRQVARLISRLRHRQFGVLVTTSFVGPQAYQELREDQHPVVIMAAKDIVNVLKTHGFGNSSAVQTWLEREFPSPR